MSDDGHLTSTKTPSDADSNSNSGSLFSRRYPDDLSSSSSGSKENTPSLQNTENLLSPKLPSHSTESTILRRVFNGLSSESLKCKPKLTRKDSIDLATAGEKSNPDDEWFTQKFRLNRREELENCQAPHRTTHANMQNCLRKRLVELRQRDQQKRKAMYNADNGIINDGLESAEIDICAFVNDEESKKRGCETQENNESMKEKDEKPKKNMMRHEADESDEDNKETVIRKTKINEEKTTLEDKNNEVEEEIAEKSENIDLNEEENTFGEDWRRDWLQTGQETYENLMKHKDHKSYLLDNEADSSNLSDETTGSEDRSSSLIDELLDDVAANCSGTFNYPEDNRSEEQNKLSKRISIDNNDDDDRDEKGEDEFMRGHRKSRKRRLLFISDDSDEDKENEGKDAPKSMKNVHNLEIDDRKDIQASNSSDCKKISADDINAVLNKNDKFNVNNRDNFPSNNEDDDHEKNVMDPTDEVNDEEDNHVEGEKETDSSDDELEMFRKLERAQKPKKKSEYIDEEASLSGDDVGSDENDDEDQLNVYEAEEGDNDELPDDETIREQLHKQWLKQQQDEENKKLLYWKDRLLVDGDLTEETDRTFRFKLRLAKNENANEEMDDVTIDADNAEVDDDEFCKRHQEISKWKIRAREAELHDESISNPLLKAASKVIDKGSLNGNSQLHEQADPSLCKNSLLCHRKSLSQVLNQTKITLYTKCASPNNAVADGNIEEENAVNHSS